MFQDFSLSCFVQQIFWLSSPTQQGSLFLLLFKLCSLLVNRISEYSAQAPLPWNHFYLSLTPSRNFQASLYIDPPVKFFLLGFFFFFLPLKIQLILLHRLCYFELNAHLYFLYALALACHWRFNLLGEGSANLCEVQTVNVFGFGDSSSALLWRRESGHRQYISQMSVAVF